MTPEQLDVIRTRADKATPGPWEWRGHNDEDPRLQGARTRIVMSVIRRERQADDPETKSYEDYVRDWETPYVDAEGKAGYRPLTDEEVAEHVKKDWLQDPWGGPQFDSRLAFRDHQTNIMEYARDLRGVPHPDREFIAHAREDIDALLAEVERLRQQRDEMIAIRDNVHETTAAKLREVRAALAAVEQDRDRWRDRCDGQAWQDIEHHRDRLLSALRELCDSGDATGRLIHPGQLRDLIRPYLPADEAHSGTAAGQ